MYLNGLLEHSDSRRYVLNVSEGQDMVIDLSTNPPLGGLITLFSDDGRVMLGRRGQHVVGGDDAGDRGLLHHRFCRTG